LNQLISRARIRTDSAMNLPIATGLTAATSRSTPISRKPIQRCEAAVVSCPPSRSSSDGRPSPETATPENARNAVSR